jgi:hypothetical protein
MNRDVPLIQELAEDGTTREQPKVCVVRPQIYRTTQEIDEQDHAEADTKKCERTNVEAENLSYGTDDT